MNNSAAFTTIADKLSKLIPRLGSDQPGEVVATVAAIGRTLVGAGLDWHDLAQRAATPSLMDALWVPQPATPVKPEPASSPSPPVKPKREPSPWPTWSTLSHFGRLAMMDEIREHGRFTPAEDEAFKTLHGAYYRQTRDLTRKEANLFNRSCRDMWERGWRPERRAA